MLFQIYIVLNQDRPFLFWSPALYFWKALKSQDSARSKKSCKDTLRLVQLPFSILWHPDTQHLPSPTIFLWDNEEEYNSLCPFKYSIISIMTKLIAEIEVVDSPAVICYLLKEASLRNISQWHMHYISFLPSFPVHRQSFSQPMPGDIRVTR